MIEFQKSLDKLDLDNILMLISILSQKALVLQQTKASKVKKSLIQM